MFEKFLTIVVIPRKASTVRRFRLPTVMVVIGVLGLIAMVLIWSWMVYDYLSIQSQWMDIGKTELSYRENKRQVAKFNEKYESIQMHLEHLKSLYYKLRLYTSLERGRKEKRHVLAQKEKAAQKARASAEGILSIIASSTDEIDANLGEERVKFDNLTLFFTADECPVNRIPKGWPVKGILMSEYGVPPDPVIGQIISNYGINIATSSSAAVRSTASGLVFYAGKDNDLKKLMTIDHGNGYVTRYGYVGNMEVKEGDFVKKGDVIAHMNHTENAIGSHLYYEVTFCHIAQNPVEYFE